MNLLEVQAYMETRKSIMLDTLSELVSMESPSRDKERLDRLARHLASQFQSLGASVQVIPNEIGGDHLLLSFGASQLSPPALALAHFDTVWPRGTILNQPFRIEGTRAYGPGTYDMKASLVLLQEALLAIREGQLPLKREVRILLTSDEEIGSPTSRALIESTAKGCAFALVPEPPLPDGQLKTSRKGVGAYQVEVEGKAAHAGVEPEKGINAINELAFQIPRILKLANPSLGSTLNVGVIEGGTTSNVVPAHASAKIDVRVTTLSEANRIHEGFQCLTPITPGTKLVVSGGINRPPMERTPAIVQLFEQARTVGRLLGLELEEGSTGGGSDGNFTAAIGIPTLDGLGVPGAGAHAINEHILIDKMPRRAALLTGLLLQ